MSESLHGKEATANDPWRRQRDQWLNLGLGLVGLVRFRAYKVYSLWDREKQDFGLVELVRFVCAVFRNHPKLPQVAKMLAQHIC